VLWNRAETRSLSSEVSPSRREFTNQCRGTVTHFSHRYKAIPLGLGSGETCIEPRRTARALGRITPALRSLRRGWRELRSVCAVCLEPGENSAEPARFAQGLGRIPQGLRSLLRAWGEFRRVCAVCSEPGENSVESARFAQSLGKIPQTLGRIPQQRGCSPEQRRGRFSGTSSYRPGPSTTVDRLGPISCLPRPTRSAIGLPFGRPTLQEP
jgi:hypothetical protein